MAAPLSRPDKPPDREPIFAPRIAGWLPDQQSAFTKRSRRSYLGGDWPNRPPSAANLDLYHDRYRTWQGDRTASGVVRLFWRKEPPVPTPRRMEYPAAQPAPRDPFLGPPEPLGAPNSPFGKPQALRCSGDWLGLFGRLRLCYRPGIPRRQLVHGCPPRQHHARIRIYHHGNGRPWLRPCCRNWHRPRHPA